MQPERSSPTKPAVVLALALSLLGNAAFAVYVVQRENSNVASDRSQEEITPTSDTRASASQRSPDQTSKGDTITTLSADAWQKFKSNGDLHDFVARLRVAGFPPAMVRTVTQHMLNETLPDPTIGLPFWQRTNPSKETMEKIHAHHRERQALFESLLGEDARPSAMMDPAYRGQRFGNIPSEKIDAITKLDRDYSELMSKTFASGVTIGEEGMNQHRLMQKEKEADLAELLTPQELEEYELRNSQAASRLMSSLRTVDVSESEYRALFRFQKEFEATQGDGMMRTASAADREAARRALYEQVRTVLTDERFTQYLESADPNYRNISQFTAQLPNISRDITYQLYELQMEAQSPYRRPNAPLSTEERGRIAASLNQRLEALVGPDVAAEYRKQGQGRIFTMGMPPSGTTQPAIRLGN